MTFAGTYTRYGHITTSHGMSANVGRGKVRESTAYEILNKPNRKGQITCHEFDPVKWPNASRGGYAGCFHPSRSMFISKLVMGPNLQAKLMEIAGVILGIYPDKKSVNEHGRDYVDPRMVNRQAARVTTVRLGLRRRWPSCSDLRTACDRGAVPNSLCRAAQRYHTSDVILEHARF